MFCVCPGHLQMNGPALGRRHGADRTPVGALGSLPHYPWTTANQAAQQTTVSWPDMIWLHCR